MSKLRSLTSNNHPNQASKTIVIILSHVFGSLIKKAIHLMNNMNL